MAMSFSYNDVLEHVELNNMILAAKGWGVLSGLDVSERGAGANMSVDVAAGSCFVNDTKYTEASLINVAISAAHATLARKDIITYDTSASNPAAVAGSPSSTPQPPNIPSGDILLAMVDIPAADTTISNSQITDEIITIVRRGWIVDGSLVLSSTASPTTWTDLDLSSYVGSNEALVFLKLENTDTIGASTIAFRQNGDTDDFYDTSYTHVSQIVNLAVGGFGYVSVPTDSSGIVEYRAEDAWLDLDVWLIGYTV